MRLDPPTWWYPPEGRRSVWHHAAPWLVSPVAAVAALATRARLARPPRYKTSLPVICIGNFTTGGTGKTPLAIEIARRLQATGAHPAFLSRGYGGSITGPYQVDPDRDTADRVGDEPLLLARTAPVIISRDRVIGAKQIERTDADVIIMDDGMQNPDLAKTLTIAVIDGHRGLGNGWPMPSGPIRGRLADQADLADVMLINGTGHTGNILDAFSSAPKAALLRASLAPHASAAALAGKDVVAFSGIGNPARFEATLVSCGANILRHHAFGDHELPDEKTATELVATAEAKRATLVTTEKDHARLSGDQSPARAALHNASYALPVTYTFESGDSGRLDALLDMVTGNRRKT